ncbi:MAG: hypothetical protein EPN72_14905 [Nevskiaceae bacterium]|nr:MAG: hypothetical protein EPN72_14905 [Nevskiaceae bacterium]TBR76192.1 MAG: hypothetical protein EPN64_08835 [Burkholderiaceae bacterium]
MSIDPTKFRETAAGHAETALTVAAEIMRNEDIAPAVRLDAGKWLTKVADLEPKQTPQWGVSPFTITINLGEGKDEILVLSPPVESMLDRLLGESEG